MGHVGPSPRCRYPLRFVFGDEFAHEGGEALHVAFTGEVGDDVTFGVDGDEGAGHARGGVGLPGGQLGVVEHGEFSVC